MLKRLVFTPIKPGLCVLKRLIWCVNVIFVPCIIIIIQVNATWHYQKFSFIHTHTLNPRIWLAERYSCTSSCTTPPCNIKHCRSVWVSRDTWPWHAIYIQSLPHEQYIETHHPSLFSLLSLPLIWAMICDILSEGVSMVTGGLPPNLAL